MKAALLLALLLPGCGGLMEDRSSMDGGAPDPVLERYVRAVCACGDGFAGCARDVRVEERAANRRCLLRYAELYERSCSGRLPDGGWNLGCAL